MENLNLKQWDEEFSPACTARGCKEKATWVGWVSHSHKECPHTGFVCAGHRDKVNNWWVRLIEAADDHALFCDKCRTRIEGLLADHLRWIPL